MGTQNNPGPTGPNPATNPGTVTTKPETNPATNPGAPSKATPTQGEGNPGYEFDKTQHRRTDTRQTEMTAMAQPARPGADNGEARKPIGKTTGNTGNSTGNKGNAKQDEDADAARVNRDAGREVKPTGIGAAVTKGADEAAADIDDPEGGIDRQPEVGSGRSPRPM